jgi:hypothetical protein
MKKWIILHLVVLDLSKHNSPVGNVKACVNSLSYLRLLASDYKWEYKMVQCRVWLNWYSRVHFSHARILSCSWQHFWLDIFTVSMWHYTVRLESHCALRLRYVDLVVSIEVAVEVCCCFTVFSC